MATHDTWYVVHTHAMAEETARTHLARQGFTAFLPQYLRRRRHARRTDWVRAPLFPRYLFVAMDIAQMRWRAVSSTIGVSRLLCHGDWPAPVPEGVVEEVMSQRDDDGLIRLATRIPFEKGQAIQVVSGALTDMVGRFECMSDEERVIMLLDLMGRPVKIKLPLDAVTAYA
jgi:transcriptional antiterminator RfaH